MSFNVFYHGRKVALTNLDILFWCRINIGFPIPLIHTLTILQHLTIQQMQLPSSISEFQFSDNSSVHEFRHMTLLHFEKNLFCYLTTWTCCDNIGGIQFMQKLPSVFMLHFGIRLFRFTRFIKKLSCIFLNTMSPQFVKAIYLIFSHINNWDTILICTFSRNLYILNTMEKNLQNNL